MSSELMIACHNGWHKEVEKLIKEGHNANFIARNAKMTPLGEAIFMNRPKVVDVLLKAGAKTERKGHHIGSELHRAALFDYCEIIELLIKFGANVNAIDSTNYYPLHRATSPEAAELLIKAGAKIGAPKGKGITAKKMAKIMGRTGVVAVIEKEEKRLKALKFEKELGDFMAKPQGPNKPTKRG